MTCVAMDITEKVRWKLVKGRIIRLNHNFRLRRSLFLFTTLHCGKRIFVVKYC